MVTSFCGSINDFPTQRFYSSTFRVSVHEFKFLYRVVRIVLQIQDYDKGIKPGTNESHKLTNDKNIRRYHLGIDYC